MRQFLEAKVWLGSLITGNHGTHVTHVHVHVQWSPSICYAPNHTIIAIINYKSIQISRFLKRNISNKLWMLKYMYISDCTYTLNADAVVILHTSMYHVYNYHVYYR